MCLRRTAELVEMYANVRRVAGLYDALAALAGAVPCSPPVVIHPSPHPPTLELNCRPPTPPIPVHNVSTKPLACAINERG
jgi:hypothetical protein